MASNDNEVRMMMSVYPGAMTGFAAMNAGLSSILNVFNAMTRAFDQQFGLVDAALTTTSVVVTQLGVDAMNAFGQFEQGMKIVQMVSGQTASDMDYLKQKANEFSVEYRTDIDQITEGLQTLGRAGLNTASEQAEVLENGLTTAKLEGRELNSVLQELIQNTALVGGNLKSNEFGEDSQYLNDLLVATSMTAPITTHDISETLKYSGGIAAAAGAKIRTDTGEVDEKGKRILEDYMGTIAAFAQKGVSGSIAGTALRAFLNKPATQDSSVTDALSSIHLKPEYLWEEGEETMKPISEQIGLIQDQMDKLNVSTMDRLQIWSKIVGGKMGQQMMKLDSDDIKEITKDIQAADSASNLASGSMKTYQANLTAAKEAGAQLQREVGEKLVLIANPLLEILNKILSFLNMDFMSMPLAGGVIAFVGYLFAQIQKVASLVRTEINSLMSFLHEGVMPYIGSKQGLIRLGDGTWVQQEPLYSSGSSKKSKTSNIVTMDSAKSFKEFDEAFSRTMRNTALSFKALKEAGLSNEQLGVLSKMQTLRHTDKYGLKDQDHVAAAMRFGLLTQKEESDLIKAIKGGASGRGALTTVFGKTDGEGFNQLRNRVYASEEAVKALGIAVSQTTWSDEEKAAAEKFAAQSVNATTQAIADETAVQYAISEAIKTTIASLQQEILAEEEALQAERNAVSAAQAHATATETVSSSEVLATESTELLTAAMNSYVPASQRFAKAITGAPMNSNVGVNPLLYPLSSLSEDDLSKMFNLKTGFGSGMPFFAGRGGMTAQDIWYMNKGLEAMLNPPKTQTAEELAAEKQRRQELRETKVPPQYPSNTDPRAEYWNRVALGATAGKYSSSILTPAEQDEAARAMGLGRHAEDTPLEKAQKKAAENIEKGTSPMSKKSDGGILYNKGQAMKLEKELEENTKVLEDQRTLNDRINARRSRILSRGSLPEEPSGMGKFGMGRNEVKQIAEESRADASYAQKVLARNERYLSRGSMSEEPSGMGKFGMTRSDVRMIAEEARKDAANAQAVRNAPNLSDQVIPKNAINDFAEHTDKNFQKIAKRQELAQKYGGQSPKLQTRYGIPQDSLKQALGKYGSSLGMSSQYNSVMTEEFKNALAKENADMIKRVQSDTRITSGMKSQGFGPTMTSQQVAAAQPATGVWTNLSNRLNADRTGRFLAFGSETDKVTGGLRSATTGVKGFANKLLNATDVLGGPVMAAMMIVPMLISQWQQAFQNYCEDLKEAGDALQSAYSNWKTAEDELKQTYREGSPDATDEEINDMILETYSTMGQEMDSAIKNHDDAYFKKLMKDNVDQPEYVYDEEKDDGSMKEKEEEEKSAEEKHNEALKQNTGALYRATAELSAATSRYVSKATDDWWGLDGWTGGMTNFFGEISDRFFNNNGLGTKFTDNNEFLLTAQQKDENYPGYTEMAGLMLEDFKDAKGDWVSGMRTMMGSDVDSFKRIIPKGTQDFLSDMASNAYGVGSANNARLQTSMKNDSKTWKTLAKEIAKQETKTKKGISKDSTKSTKRIEGLINKLNYSMGGKFDRTQILQAAYLQEMQDMYQVAQSVMVPIISQHAQTAANSLIQESQMKEQINGTGGNTYETAAIASAISAMVAQIAMAQSADAVYNSLLLADPESTDLNGDGFDSKDKAIIELAQSQKSGTDFLREASKMGYSSSAYGEGAGSPGGVSFGRAMAGTRSGGGQTDPINTAAIDYILQNYLATAKMTVYGYDVDTANKFAKDEVERARKEGLTTMDMFNTYAKNYQSKSFLDQLTGAYLMADDGAGDSSGGGGGSGSGSGNKDKDQGTKKERVDLVLCNKKEIPKLNVNLFKKAPSFTILNKNFKLRDIKVNTQDKPKAVLASIKNAIIDVQKRTDPKIIQDEEAIYDPVGATDGNTPSGSSDVRTDSN